MKARPTTKADETPEFQAFWAVWYPIKNKNDGRGDARDEFFRHVEQYGADPQDLVDGAKWFVFDGGNKEFKQHASTWLNRRAYEDGAEEWRKHEQRIAERSANVVQMQAPVRAVLPENHFSKRYARGEVGRSIKTME